MWSHANLQPRVSQSFNFQYLSDNSGDAALWTISSISPPLINVSLVSLFHIESTPILVMSAWQRHFWIYIIIYFKFHYSQRVLSNRASNWSRLNNVYSDQFNYIQKYWNLRSLAALTLLFSFRLHFFSLFFKFVFLWRSYGD